MEIDDQVEEKVRDTLHWAVKRQDRDFDAALARFSTRAERSAALELLVAISRFVTYDLCAGTPSPGQVAALAAEIAVAESWSGLSSDEVGSYLDLVTRGDLAQDQLTGEAFVVLSFVVSASLLAMRPKQEGEWWFDYLDRVESALEAAG
ncbi:MULTISPECIES: hypothetical protein [Micromonospora]|uniref:Uncharacterized protein n=1 Tax=Micromonospora yangpuensis TaxID=683228 RepID=A0A1C6V9U4_9ACTN|nr:hypothetical protein [Micromonospora yangpuensis]GGM21882.1 hypothetical protein GCM10012279_45280 [Micromonospora yangpuensis]SCL62854.1 hypothetical protein GA0070617_5039 [Micromonospora yangpuensis]